MPNTFLIVECGDLFSRFSIFLIFDLLSFTKHTPENC